jgi:hypothetical protein
MDFISKIPSVGYGMEEAVEAETAQARNRSQPSNLFQSAKKNF